MKSFASDNISGADPRILEALTSANTGTTFPYGADPWTEEAHLKIKEIFGNDARTWFVFTGTAANILGLRSLLRPYQGIICADTAHINRDECAAPEAIGGTKLLPVSSFSGKISLPHCAQALSARETVHHCYPKALSITQATELGTLYTLEELQAIGAFCRQNDLYLHMDGSRLANAAAALNVPLADLTTKIGVDVLSFGGTKNGLVVGEAVIFLNPELGTDFSYYHKQGMQLGAKMRFISSQFLAYFQNDLWLHNARSANNAARYLAEKIKGIPHVQLEYPAEINALFVRMPQRCIKKLQQDFYFYVTDPTPANGFPEDWQQVRFMTSFNTSAKDLDTFAEAIAHCAS